MINFVNFVPLFAKVIKVAIETFLFFLLILKSLSLHRDSIILYYKNDSSKWSFLEYFFHILSIEIYQQQKEERKTVKHRIPKLSWKTRLTTRRVCEKLKHNLETNSHRYSPNRTSDTIFLHDLSDLPPPPSLTRSTRRLSARIFPSSTNNPPPANR